MLCYLYSARKQVRENGLPFFVCVWKGQQGEIGGDIVKDGFLNVKKALAREVTLVRSIFPTSEEEVETYRKALKSCFREKVLEDGTKELKPVEGVTSETATKVYLQYKQIPLSELDTDVKKISYINSNGQSVIQSHITVIGFCELDENGNEVWAESDPKTLAQNNLNRGLQTGAYIPVEEEDSKKSQQTKQESKEEGKTDSKPTKEDNDDDW